MTSLHPVMESLLNAIEADPVPQEHASSFWRLHGRQTVVERRDGDVRLEGSGFGTMRARHPVLRALHACQRASYWPVTRPLRTFPPIWNDVKRLARDLSFDLTFDVWKSGVALALLEDHWRVHGLRPRVITIIGDGYGFLGALIRRVRPAVRLYCIDLPKTLVFQVRTHEQADPTARLSRLTAAGDTDADVAFVLPGDAERIPETIDCAINIASMQEMPAASLDAYFRFLRRRSGPSSRFYCVNRQRKELPGGEVTEFRDYPWRSDDEVFMDGPCPYYTHFVSPATLPHGPRILGLRVPGMNYFDGVTWHRLARLAPERPEGS